MCLEEIDFSTHGSDAVMASQEISFTPSKKKKCFINYNGYTCVYTIMILCLYLWVRHVEY